jgi:hypothetical protein
MPSTEFERTLAAKPERIDPAQRKEAIMNTSKHLSVIPAITDGDASRAPSGLPLDIALGAIVVAILLTGVAAGGAFAPDWGAPVAEPQASAAQPSQEFVYFPSQYVNQGTEIPEPTPTF